jgi:DNA-binding response OmpR family regulator
MKTILIVEDDKDIQDIFSIIFTSFGYKVESMESSAALVNKTDNFPDAIILDKQLPGVNGVEICKTLKDREATRHIPVLMISATSGVKEAAKIAGADDFLEKPFNMHVILKKVSSLLDSDAQVISR